VILIIFFKSLTLLYKRNVLRKKIENKQTNNDIALERIWTSTLFAVDFESTVSTISPPGLNFTIIKDFQRSVNLSLKRYRFTKIEEFLWTGVLRFRWLTLRWPSNPSHQAKWWEWRRLIYSQSEGVRGIRTLGTIPCTPD
jgi:hypothetical protein